MNVLHRKFSAQRIGVNRRGIAPPDSAEPEKSDARWYSGQLMLAISRPSSTPCSAALDSGSSPHGSSPSKQSCACCLSSKIDPQRNRRLREILRGFLPCISMVKAADAWKSHNFRARRRTCLSYSALWRILDRSVNPVRVVIADVVSKKAT